MKQIIIRKKMFILILLVFALTSCITLSNKNYENLDYIDINNFNSMIGSHLLFDETYFYEPFLVNRYNSISIKTVGNRNGTKVSDEYIYVNDRLLRHKNYDNNGNLLYSKEMTFDANNKITQIKKVKDNKTTIINYSYIFEEISSDEIKLQIFEDETPVIEIFYIDEEIHYIKSLIGTEIINYDEGFPSKLVYSEDTLEVEANIKYYNNGNPQEIITVYSGETVKTEIVKLNNNYTIYSKETSEIPTNEKTFAEYKYDKDGILIKYIMYQNNTEITVADFTVENGLISRITVSDPEKLILYDADFYVTIE